MPHDQHLIAWFQAKFNIKVLFTGREYSIENCYSSNTVWGAVCEYAASYNGIMLDKLVEMEG